MLKCILAGLRVRVVSGENGKEDIFPRPGSVGFLKKYSGVVGPSPVIGRKRERKFVVPGNHRRRGKKKLAIFIDVCAV